MTQTANTSNVSREMIVIIRPSFVRLCEGDGCRAALFNHLLYWIAQKAKGLPEEKISSGEVYWYGSLEDIRAALAGTWGLSKVRKELKALVSAGLIGQRHNPKVGWDRKYQYFFWPEQGKKLKDLCEKEGINLGELGLSVDILHLLESTEALVAPNQYPNSPQPMPAVNTTDPAVTCNEWTCHIQPMHLAKTTDPSVKNNGAIPKDSPEVIIPKDTLKNSTKISTEGSTDVTSKETTKGATHDEQLSDQSSEIAANAADTYTSVLKSFFQKELDALVLLATAHFQQTLTTQVPYVAPRRDTGLSLSAVPVATFPPARTGINPCPYGGHLPVPEQLEQKGSTPLKFEEMALSSSIQRQQPADRKEKPGQKTTYKTSKTDDIALTREGQHILDLYDEFKGRSAVRNAATLLAANKLGAAVSNDEDFREVLKAIVNDPFLKQKQVRTDLDFVSRKYDGFLDRVEKARGKQTPGSANSKLDYNEVIGWTDEQRAAYKRKMQEEMQRALPPGMTVETFMQMKPKDRIIFQEQLRRQEVIV